MPYGVRYKEGRTRPYAIYNLDTGKEVGSSTSKSKAESSIRARLAGEHDSDWNKRKGVVKSKGG